MSCQLKALESAEKELSVGERVYRRTRRKMHSLSVRAISFLKRRMKHLFLRKKIDKESQEIKEDTKTIPPLNLKVGEIVRVKSVDEIKKTLDGNNKFQGLEYTLAMDKYCRGTYRVFRKVDRAFDERRWELSRVKNVVLLEGVYCDGDSGIEVDWDGCDRSCFLWWKEAWLERLGDKEKPSE